MRQHRQGDNKSYRLTHDRLTQIDIQMQVCGCSYTLGAHSFKQKLKQKFKPNLQQSLN